MINRRLVGYLNYLLLKVVTSLHFHTLVLRDVDHWESGVSEVRVVKRRLEEAEQESR